MIIFRYKWLGYNKYIFHFYAYQSFYRVLKNSNWKFPFLNMIYCNLYIVYKGKYRHLHYILDKEKKTIV